MGFVKEFKEFALKGSVMDLAVGVIIGAAFGKIVDSVVNDLIMPIVGTIVGPQGFANSYVVLGGKDKWIDGMSLVKAREAGVNVFAWGNFITIVLNFIIMAIIIFWMVKMMNRMKKETPPPPAEPSSTDKLLAEIRDALKK
jgi:large conductance mechanosensitive channel